jgi:hypothetical protein
MKLRETGDPLNRRSFLRALVALPVAATLPALPTERFASGGLINRVWSEPLMDKAKEHHIHINGMVSPDLLRKIAKNLSRQVQTGRARMVATR